MILVVVPEDVGVDVPAERRVERVDSVAAAGRALEAGAADAVVLARRDAAAEAIRGLRDGDFGHPRMPVVLATGDRSHDLPVLAFDQTVDPDDSGALRSAVEAALGVADYQAVVRDLYEECQSRAESGVTDPLVESRTLSELRAEADDRLDALLSDPEVVADLLWTPAEGSDFGFGRAVDE